MSTELAGLISLHDVEKRALEILSKAVRDYYASGADDEETLRMNRAAFKAFLVRPFVLRDVSALHTGVQIYLRSLNESASPFKMDFGWPIGIAPTAFQRMAHERGELATAEAAAQSGTLMVCSTLSTVPLEEVATAHGQSNGNSLWFQLYVYKDRQVTEKLVRRAERAGFSALVFTVDSPLFGKRRADERNAFRLPSHLKLANFAEMEDEQFSSLPQGDLGASGLTLYVNSLFDPSLSWKDLEWLVHFSRLPVLVKGIVRADDALRAVKAGAAGIVVSNHGGRQLDHCVPTIEALPEVVDAVGGQIPVFVDGGFRTGTDIFKALALGARMVFVGRPIVYGLAVGGREGVRHVLNLLKSELEYAMKLAGCASIKQIQQATDRIVVRKSFFSKI